ncbi:hypothetical protein L2D14_17825 [Thalassospiraceae bacterium LMO-JJ14]|nr:hypothetical protein L2D14_17825 [Thalassospiraceae bacterium LMO-JJ14]
MNDKDAFRYWMENVQAVDLGDREIMDPSRSGTSIGDTLRKAGGGLEFDTEPAQYYKLLKEISAIRPGN